MNKKNVFKNKELWRQNLSKSLKGRKAWNKGRKGLQVAWNKKELPSKTIIDLYKNKNLSSNKIANKFNVDTSVISRILKENNITLKGMRGFYKGMSLVEMLGKEKAELRSKIMSEKLKLVKHIWGKKISKSLKEYYRKNPVSEKRRKESSSLHRKLWQNPEYRNNLIKKRKDYLKNHPEELERLKKIQYPGKITKTEQKFLNFLKENFKENEDFYFDKQDTTGKTFYRPDFQFPRRKIIFELDGYYKHYTKEGYQKDKIREYYLKKAGWEVYRFNYFEIERNYKFEDIKNKVLGILQNG